jgi:hypothetical protein
MANLDRFALANRMGERISGIPFADTVIHELRESPTLLMCSDCGGARARTRRARGSV